MSKQVFATPTQPLDLPSKGLVYSQSSSLSSGIVDLYLPTALHEDILTNRNYIQQGIVLDKFLQSVIASDIEYDDLITGDKNAILIASRILAYGSKYSFKYSDTDSKQSETITVDLSELKNKEVDWSLFTPGVNQFSFELPMTKVLVDFRLLTTRDDQKIDAELAGLRKVNKNISADVTVKLYHSIIAINGNTDQKAIRDFVKSMPMRDSQELRKYMTKVSPDVEMKFDYTRSNGEVLEGLNLPMTVDFFWPNT
jgi:hypothetical protein